jgi:hypothetical protein
VGILGNEVADQLAKAGANPRSTHVTSDFAQHRLGLTTLIHETCLPFRIRCDHPNLAQTFPGMHFTTHFEDHQSPPVSYPEGNICFAHSTKHLRDHRVRRLQSHVRTWFPPTTNRHYHSPSTFDPLVQRPCRQDPDPLSPSCGLTYAQICNGRSLVGRKPGRSVP